MSFQSKVRQPTPGQKIGPLLFVLFLTLPLVYSQAGSSTQIPDCECKAVSKREYKAALRPNAVKLLEEVQATFGKSVCVEEVENYKPNEHGKACVSKDGTPVIKINPATDDIERTIVHELFHLKFRADGFADINYYFPDLQISKDVLLSIDNTFLQTVEHWMFFPAIRKMGIDPAAHHKAALRAGEYKTIDRTDIRSLAYRYYDAKLLVDNANLVGQLTSWYKAKGLSEAIVKGEELVGLVTNSNPKTPEDEILTYVKVLNAVPEINAGFQLDSWNQVMLGSFKWRIAVIRIRAKL